MNELFSLISIYIIMVLMMQESCEFQEDGVLEFKYNNGNLKAWFYELEGYCCCI